MQLTEGEARYCHAPDSTNIKSHLFSPLLLTVHVKLCMKDTHTLHNYTAYVRVELCIVRLFRSEICAWDIIIHLWTVHMIKTCARYKVLVSTGYLSFRYMTQQQHKYCIEKESELAEHVGSFLWQARTSQEPGLGA